MNEHTIAWMVAPAPILECSIQELLQSVPLHSPRTVPGLFLQPQHGNLLFPESIHVHCDHKVCGGIRRHSERRDNKFQFGEFFFGFVSYVCTNCKGSAKVFAVKAERKSEMNSTGLCTKIYEEPPFGLPIPKRLFHVIGEANRDYFLQARRAIARGLGIGAYAYYRRIVENTKFDLIGSILEVAVATNALPKQIDVLKRAQSETQFSKAIEMVSDVSTIPAVLLIDGHNPLSLLHGLLSEGIHQLTDEECLERAQHSEVILCEIADRMQIAMTERKAVKEAIRSIMKPKKPPTS